jgi:hypothetical protein
MMIQFIVFSEILEITFKQQHQRCMIRLLQLLLVGTTTIILNNSIIILSVRQLVTFLILEIDHGRRITSQFSSVNVSLCR